MAEVGKLITGFILFTLFSFIAIAFMTEMATINEADISEVGGGALDSTQFSGTLNTSISNSSNLKERLNTGNFEDIDNPSAIKEIMEDATDFVTTPFKLLNQVMVNTLQFPEIIAGLVTGVFGLLITIAIITGLWRLFRVGD